MYQVDVRLTVPVLLLDWQYAAMTSQASETAVMSASCEILSCSDDQTNANLGVLTELINY